MNRSIKYYLFEKYSDIFQFIMTEHSLSSASPEFQDAPSPGASESSKPFWCSTRAIHYQKFNKAAASCELCLTSVISALQTTQLVCMRVIACKYDNCCFPCSRSCITVLSLIMLTLCVSCVCASQYIRLWLALSPPKVCLMRWMIQLIIHHEVRWGNYLKEICFRGQM